MIGKNISATVVGVPNAASPGLYGLRASILHKCVPPGLKPSVCNTNSRERKNHNYRAC
uniref:Uncharacterized protein n=1 Tax=uncultured Poribacteria bacterium 64K2 TaxID=309182 RepID=Q24M36_9BACT|nr:hypothetical protein [uncultured Poribacteria bacterium 64K2]